MGSIAQEHLHLRVRLARYAQHAAVETEGGRLGGHIPHEHRRVRFLIAHPGDQEVPAIGLARSARGEIGEQHRARADALPRDGGRSGIGAAQVRHGDGMHRDHIRGPDAAHEGRGHGVAGDLGRPAQGGPRGGVGRLREARREHLPVRREQGPPVGAPGDLDIQAEATVAPELQAVGHIGGAALATPVDLMAGALPDDGGDLDLQAVAAEGALRAGHVAREAQAAEGDPLSVGADDVGIAALPVAVLGARIDLEIEAQRLIRAHQEEQRPLVPRGIDPRRREPVVVRHHGREEQRPVGAVRHAIHGEVLDRV